MDEQITTVPMIWWDLNTWAAWQSYLLLGITMALQLVFCSIVIGRTGRTPYWALLTLIPYFYAPLVGLWMLAFCEWPRIERKA